MKKVKFTGKVETFYFVPDCQTAHTEKAVLYMSVTSQRNYPNGGEESLSPPQKMRFTLSGREMGVLSQGNTVALGDKVSVSVNEDSSGNLSYNLEIIEQKNNVIEAKDYVKKQFDKNT